VSHRTSAEVVLDSITPYGDETRLTSMYVVFPKMVLGERNRHRGFSLSDRSSRAVPPEKLIQEVRDDPAMPALFRGRTTGMGGGVEFGGTALSDAREAWRKAARQAADRTEEMTFLNLAKEVVNRGLDPYIRMHSLMTATRDVWLNFFGLRLDAGADPTIQVLAQRCFEAYRASTPKLLQPGEWYLPFVNPNEDVGHPENWNPILGSDSPDDDYYYSRALKLSAARCAHLSYNDLETGQRMTVEKALRIYDRLITSRPIHASPTEHQACVDILVPNRESWTKPSQLSHPEQSGNFTLGWVQARKLIPGEAVAELPERFVL
jgi:thymidylate synthase ThyX